MRFSLLLFLAVTGFTVFAVPIAKDDIKDKDIYPRFMEIPGGDGLMQTVDLEAEPDYDLIKKIIRNPADNQYLLFTRQNPLLPQALGINNVNSITRSNFNARVPTVVIVHGWLSNQNTDINPTIRRAYLNKSDVNVIVMDWGRLALADYVTAVQGVPAIGWGLGQFLTFLSQTTGAPLTSMHLIGFSLGAHVVGNAGRALGGRVARVSGLDPAGPLWHLNVNRLRPEDGIYVEAIHTDGSTYGLGIGSAVADASFFPNGGITQPGCITNFCSHNRAWEFFASTVTHNHLIGRRCTSATEVAMNLCRGQQLHMGNDILTKTGSGLFRVNTGSRYPF